MALTIARGSDGLGPTTKNFGAVKFSLVEITFDSSYPTGGESVAAADVGLARIDFALVPGLNVDASRLIAWDQDNSKLLLFTDFSTEAANTSDQSTISAIVCFVGV